MRATSLSRVSSRGALLACLPALLLIPGAPSQQGPSTPPRPTLGPGESNWVPPAAAPEGGLVTADLASGLTPLDLAAALVGPGVTVSNVTFTGANVGAGTFTGGSGIVGFESGIVLGTGNIASVVGPNASDSTTTVNGVPGDADLEGLIPGFTTSDASVLEFDFECPSLLVISFEYRFTSEEYNEFVNSSFNDVVGFFLNGANIALVPGSAAPVSVNTVNCNNPFNPPTGSNCLLYLNNDCGDISPGTFPCAGISDTEMDGMTAAFFATAPVNPGLNHIKLAIADAGDLNLDSNVFIKGESFLCKEPKICALHTQGFWQNHEKEWPKLPDCGGIPGLQLGTVCYHQNELIKILEEPSGGSNGIVALAHQLIAAKLNVLLCGACPVVEQAILDADNLIGNQVVPPFGTGFVDVLDSEPIATILDDYNNDLLDQCP